MEYVPDRFSIDRVVDLVCGRLGVDAAALRDGRRSATVSRAREAVAWLAVRWLGLRQVEVARATGVGFQAMTSVLRRAEAREDALRAAFPELGGEDASSRSTAGREELVD